MVKVQIVEEQDVSASSPYASDDDSRTSSSVSLSSVDSAGSVDESFFDRVAALVDIVPPSTRHSISSRISRTASFLKRGGKIAGSIVWVVTTSALLVALPLALSLEDEAKIVAQEKEMLEQQQGAQQVCVLLPSSFPQTLTLPLVTDACPFYVSARVQSQPTTKRPCATWILRHVEMSIF